MSKTRTFCGKLPARGNACLHVRFACLAKSSNPAPTSLPPCPRGSSPLPSDPASFLRLCTRSPSAAWSSARFAKVAAGSTIRRLNYSGNPSFGTRMSGNKFGERGTWGTACAHALRNTFEFTLSKPRTFSGKLPSRGNAFLLARFACLANPYVPRPHPPCPRSPEPASSSASKRQLPSAAWSSGRFAKVAAEGTIRWLTYSENPSFGTRMSKNFLSDGGHKCLMSTNSLFQYPSTKAMDVPQPHSLWYGIQPLCCPGLTWGQVRASPLEHIHGK